MELERRENITTTTTTTPTTTTFLLASQDPDRRVGYPFSKGVSKGGSRGNCSALTYGARMAWLNSGILQHPPTSDGAAGGKRCSL